MTVSSRIIVSTVIVLVVLTVQSAAAQQAPVPPRGNQPTNANEPRATNGTVYTNKTELFATFRPPFIVGQATRIGAHLSKLGERFLPYADVTVTATLTVAGVSVKQSLSKRDRPGVFRLELTPEKAGTGSLVFDIAGPDGTDRLVFDNVLVYTDRADALARQGPNLEAGAIRYSKEQSWDENEYASAPVERRMLENNPASSRVLAVPRTAILQIEGAPHVYVQRHPEAFDLKEVKTGKSSGMYVEITSGLREGERIVIKGADRMPRK